jgi:3'-5' exoribonuclease
MLTLARLLLTLYPQLDRYLFITGIILHDLGSLAGERYERAIDYSDAGRLVGHIVLGDRMVTGYIAAIADFPPDLALTISHMILSHHGETEHGTVREPLTLEANALYLLNKLSAELNHVQQVLDSQWDVTKPWTEFDPMTRRYFFRGHVREAEATPESPPPTYPTVEESTGGDLPSLADKSAKAPQPKK